MPFPILPIALLAAAGGGAYMLTRKKEEPRPEEPEGTEAVEGPPLNDAQKKIYSAAMANIKEPEKLKTLATAFRKAGYPKHAKKLEQRAALHAAPQPVKRQRRKIMKAALKSSNPTAVHGVADAFSEIGADGTAAKLREYATSISPE